MPIATGTYALGPDRGTLTVKTGKTGAAAKAGHNLTLEVTAWEATLVVADDPAGSSLALTADARSLRVREGTGGMQALGHAENESIEQSIDDDVLKGTPIVFRSTAVTADADGLRVEGDLELRGAHHPVAFALAVDDAGVLTGSAVLEQSNWKMKPFSILFGTLKVADAVEVLARVELPTS